MACEAWSPHKWSSFFLLLVCALGCLQEAVRRVEEGYLSCKSVALPKDSLRWGWLKGGAGVDAPIDCGADRRVGYLMICSMSTDGPWYNEPAGEIHLENTLQDLNPATLDPAISVSMKPGVQNFAPVEVFTATSVH
jgi:hypothetical protein